MGGRWVGGKLVGRSGWEMISSLQVRSLTIKQSDLTSYQAGGHVWLAHGNTWRGSLDHHGNSI